jgi:hypothetical protein
LKKLNGQGKVSTLDAHSQGSGKPGVRGKKRTRRKPRDPVRARETTRLWREKNKEKVKEQRRRYYLKHREKHLEYNRNIPPIRRMESDLKRLYGLTLEQYFSLSEAQQHVCQICREECTSGKRLSVDHEHSTGVVRGLLCVRCNQGIGMFKDDIKRLQSAVLYLKNFARNNPLMDIKEGRE